MYKNCAQHPNRQGKIIIAIFNSEIFAGSISKQIDDVLVLFHIEITQ